MESTPRSNRLHIGFFGRRNAGKSSLINFLTGQSLAIVSDVAGTTADPVLKSMELLPLGPVVLIDTAGLDDVGDLGTKRVAKSKEMMDRTDLAILVISAETARASLSLEKEFRERKVPVFAVLSQVDLISDSDSLKCRVEEELGLAVIPISVEKSQGREELLVGIVENAPNDFERASLVGELLPKGAPVILVAPQDLQAPKGRLILPQVQTIRDLLDADTMALVVKDSELSDLLNLLKEPPALVITDSQIFPKVRDMLPERVPLTSFSILMARYKGDLATFVAGARKIKDLTVKDKVLIAEACTHHAMDDDIGRVKIPNWLRKKVGDHLQIDVVSGFDFPTDLETYSLIIHCGGCMFTRKQLMSRLIKAEAVRVPITNYGTAIAALNGMLEQVIGIFPEIEE